MDLVQKRRKINWQHVIALTGGIGSGKSFAIKCFAKLGFHTFDTDAAIHRLLSSNREVYQKIKTLFPESIDQQGINKNILGQITFKQPERLKQLEAILYPLLIEERNFYIAKLHKARKGPIILEIPLLFEKGVTYNYDLIISTITTAEIQRYRTMRRKGMTAEKFDAIMALQTTNEHRIKHSGLVINTSYGTTNTLRQIKKLIYNAKFERDSIRYRNNWLKSSRW